MLPRTGIVLDRAAKAARSRSDSVIGTENLLIGILQEGGSVAALLLRRQIQPSPLAARLEGWLPESFRSHSFQVGWFTEEARAAGYSVGGLALLTFWWFILGAAMFAGFWRETWIRHPDRRWRVPGGRWQFLTTRSPPGSDWNAPPGRR